MLLQLPGEIRNLIYSHLFTSTRLTFGERYISRISVKRMRPGPNSLAILRTCRLINQEARGLWLGQVLFNFEQPADMLDKLSALSSSTLSQIRHIRVLGNTLMLTPNYDNDIHYRLAWALKLLPGLCLDTLSVLGLSNGLLAYNTLDGLIKDGNGWKELRYITPTSEMLGFKRVNMLMTDPYWRKPQPSTWNDILLQRDGLDSGACVTIYRSTRSDAPGTVLKPETCQLFEQKPPASPDGLKMFGVNEDKQLLSMHEKGKELLVVVKRGRQAHILEETNPAYFHEQDIRNWTRGMTWPEIRRKYHDFSFESDDDSDFLDEDKDAEADRYNDVDEYAWNPVH